MTDKPFRLSVGSADEYNELIAEISFPSVCGIIISQEKGEGNYEVSLHSFSPQASDNFDYTKNTEGDKIPLDALMDSLKLATDRLKSLARNAA